MWGKRTTLFSSHAPPQSNIATLSPQGEMGLTQIPRELHCQGVTCLTAGAGIQVPIFMHFKRGNGMRFLGPCQGLDEVWLPDLRAGLSMGDGCSKQGESSQMPTPNPTCSFSKWHTPLW